MSRTASKLDKVNDELLKINAKIKTKILVRDFCKNSNMEFYEDIRKEVGNLEIGLMIVNAGIYRPGPMHKVESSVIESMLDANVYHVGAFVKKFLPALTSRTGKRFGLITVSSAIGYCPSPNNTTYAATKAFVN